MTLLDTLLDKIKRHSEHHYKVLANDTHKMIKELVKSEDKQDLYLKTLE